MNHKDVLARVGVKDLTFEFLTIEELVKLRIIEKPLDGNHGEIHPKGGDFISSGIPFIMASDINNGVVDYTSCKFIAKKQADSLRKGFAKNGDVLLTHKATIGRTAIVKYDEQPYVMLTPQVTYYRVRNHQKLDHRYLRYYFESSFFQNLFNLWAGAGATRAYLGITEQGKLPFVLPPIKKQRKIAAILSAYNDLIENNRRRITLLEKMAEEIYREWFVRLRFPGHKQAKFEKGVPIGWRHTELRNVCSLIKRGITPRYSDAAKTIVINQRCIRQGAVNLDEARPHETRVSEEKIIQYGDVLINSTGVGTLGRVAVFDHEYTDVTCDTHVTICRADADVIDMHYLGYTIRTLQTYFENMAVGSTGQSELGRDLIGATKILLPNLEVQRNFADTINSMWRNKRLLTREIKVLVQTRDALLPRLISGKLSVEDLDIHFPLSMKESAHEI